MCCNKFTVYTLGNGETSINFMMLVPYQDLNGKYLTAIDGDQHNMQPAKIGDQVAGYVCDEQRIFLSRSDLWELRDTLNGMYDRMQKDSTADAVNSAGTSGCGGSATETGSCEDA